MKIFIKLFILALIAGLAAPFFLKGPNGLPLLNYKDFIPNTDSVLNSVSPSAPSKLYKWQDSKGHWQFGDTPPEGAKAQEMHVSTPINSMKTIDLPEGFKTKEVVTKRFDPLDTNASPLSTAPIEKVPEMLETIDGFQETLNQKNKELESL